MRPVLGAARRAAAGLLGQHCLLCDAPSREASVCPACAGTLPQLPPHCPRCAMPSPAGAVCGDCLVHPPHYDETVALWPYEFPVDRLVQALKFHARLELAAWFADAIARHGAFSADVVVAMPLHPRRLAERGFNQAHEVARVLARRTAIPVLAREVRRIRATGEQAHLPHRERARNVRGAFACGVRLSGLRVAVVDDVMTTGATLNELARTLNAAGAARVVNVVIARTMPP
jgi:ComF family protein